MLRDVTDNQTYDWLKIAGPDKSWIQDAVEEIIPHREDAYSEMEETEKNKVYK